MADNPPHIVIERLAYEDDRPAHIARHDVTIAEVFEVINGDYLTFAKLDRYMIVGQTAGGRFLAVVVGNRDQPGTYGLVTARTARRDERARFLRLTKGEE